MVGELASYDGSITFRGVGLRVDRTNPLVTPVVTGDFGTTSLSPSGIAQVDLFLVS